MFNVYAYKTTKTTSAGNPVYAVMFAHDYEYCERHLYKPNRKIADRVDAMAYGDDSFYNVLDEDCEYIILNADGEIDIDTEAQKIDGAAQQKSGVVDADWDEQDDDYVDD